MVRRKEVASVRATVLMVAMAVVIVGLVVLTAWSMVAAVRAARKTRDNDPDPEE